MWSDGCGDAFGPEFPGLLPRRCRNPVPLRPGAWAWHVAAADAAVSDVVTAALLTFGSPGGLVLAMSRFEKRKKKKTGK